MKCYLMNKNKKVAMIGIDNNTNTINEIFEIFDIDYAPLVLKNSINDKSQNSIKVLNNWYKSRGIPSWRKDIENLLKKLNISSPDELLNKAYSLSLSDQYWIKEENQNIDWKDINFFTNDFKYKGYFEASMSSSFDDEIDLRSPNNTTDGMLQKAWIIENGKRVLVKGTYYFTRQEPINEWLVSEICNKLNIEHCKYGIDILDDKIISKCDDFITQDQEIITAYDIFNSKHKSNNVSDYEHYISILEENGINNAREKLENMLLIDYVVLNFDRHMKNFGVIRNVENLKWENLTPIFDTGECMECDKLDSEINFKDGKCKFFMNTNKNSSDLLKYIDITRYDFSKLKDIPNDFKNILKKYQEYTKMSNERINILSNGLKYRITTLEKLNKIINENNQEDENEDELEM